MKKKSKKSSNNETPNPNSIPRAFTLSKYIYRVDEIDSLLDDFPFIKTNKKREYLNVASAFDIESTSFYRLIGNPSMTCKKPPEDEYDDWEKCAIEYAFVFGINGRCIIGRTWEEFMIICHKLSDRYHLFSERRMIIYIHNLGFEFQFFKDRFEWMPIFAEEERVPLACLTTLGIEFRDSYLLTGYNLENVGKNLHKYKVEKAVGDLDYSLFRHTKTPLTNKELGYILNDGLVVMAHIQEEIERLGDITKLPFTKTGYVRKYCRNMCLYDGSHRHNLNKFYRYHEKMTSCQITSVEEYKQLKRGFQGGFTHASGLYSGQVVKDVTSYDFTSSYPAVMIMERFPMGTGKLVQLKSTEEFNKYLELYCCLFDVYFENIESTFLPEHYISKSKCEILENESTDNGRIVSASKLSTTITEQDYFIIKKTYKWTKMIVKQFRIYPKQYLPRDFVRAILKLYNDKTTLKNVAGKEAEYNHAKEDLNSCFGMSVTDISRPDIYYEDGKWGLTQPNIEDDLRRYNLSKRRFLCYQWGVWVTAYARRNLWSGILECGTDYCYSDTDSLKIRNVDRHLQYIKDYNEYALIKLKDAMEFHQLPLELVMPKTIEGKIKVLGYWDFDGHYNRFKTLGAKRYFMELDDSKHKMTVSGVSKKKAVPYLEQLAKEKKVDIFELFNDNLFIPPEYTGKNIHTYIDYPIKGVLRDYTGKLGEYEEYSSVHLEETSYNLTMTTSYIEYLKGIREINNIQGEELEI